MCCGIRDVFTSFLGCASNVPICAIECGHWETATSGCEVKGGFFRLATTSNKDDTVYGKMLKCIVVLWCSLLEKRSVTQRSWGLQLQMSNKMFVVNAVDLVGMCKGVCCNRHMLLFFVEYECLDCRKGHGSLNTILKRDLQVFLNWGGDGVRARTFGNDKLGTGHFWQLKKFLVIVV